MGECVLPFLFTEMRYCNCDTTGEAYMLETRKTWHHMTQWK